MSFTQNIDPSTVLSLIEVRDTDEIFTLVDTSRDYLRKWLPWVDFNTTSEDTKAFIQSAQQQYAENNGFHCCIRYEAKIAGVIGYHRIDWRNQTTELGYWLGEQYQGLGLMTKCCRILTNYAFTHLNLNRVEIRVASTNLKSCAIPERLGFINEGILRDAEWLNDRFVDNVVYSILLREWGKVNAV